MAAMTAAMPDGAGAIAAVEVAAEATTTAGLEAEMTAAGAEGAAVTIADAAGAVMMAVATAVAMPDADAVVVLMTAQPGAAMTTRAITTEPTIDPGQEPRISTRPGLAHAERRISLKCGGCGDAARMTPELWRIMEAA